MTEYTRFSKTHKTDISEYNAEEIRGWVINEMNNIESMVNKCILDFFVPQNEQIFKKVVLNSSVISSGAKLKILRYIPSFDKKIIAKIQDASSIRNAFAHIPIYPVLHIKREKDSDGNVIDHNLYKVSSKIDVMNSAGDIKSKDAREEVKKFQELHVEIMAFFKDNYS